MQPNIYISYSWKPEDMAIADAIDKDWQAVGIKLIRDKRDVNFKDSLKDFMQGMSSGDYILVIISQGYLESKNCMYEALELFQHPNFKDKILPIFAPSANIHSATGKLIYITYWDRKINELNEQLRQLGGGLANLQSIYEELNHYTRIRNSIAAFSGVLTDMRAANWPEIKEQNYKEIFEHINYENTDILQECLHVLMLNDEEEQEIALDELSASHPGNEFVLFAQGNLAFKGKKYRKAKKLFEEVLPKVPFLALYQLGLIAENVNNYREARDYYEEAVRTEPFDALAHNALGNLLRREFKEPQVARHHYEQALSLLPNLAAAHFNLADLLTNEFQNEHSFQEYPLARWHYERALALKPDFAEAHHGLGRLLRNVFEEYSLAQQHYEEAINLSPGFAAAHNSLGILFSSNILKPQLARHHYEEAVRLEPNYAVAHLNLANLFLTKLNEYSPARNHYEKALELHPDYIEAHFKLGYLFANFLNEFSLARSQFEQVLLLQPEHTEAKYQLARLLANHFHRPEMLREQFEKQLVINPQTANEHHISASFYGLMAPKAQRDVSLAIMHHNQSVELDPSYATNPIVNAISVRNS